MSRPPVERTTRYETKVRSLEEAFAFVMANMENVDEVTSISIRPALSFPPEPQLFSVAVEGTMELAAYQPESL